MTHLRIHLVYLALLGFLAYQYWTKTQALNEAVSSIEQFNRMMTKDVQIVSKTSTIVKNQIDIHVSGYRNTTNSAFKEKARNAMIATHFILEWLEKQKLELINIAGGFNKKDTSILENRLSSKPSREFFTDQKIQQIRDSISLFINVLSDVSEESKLKELTKRYGTHTLLNDTDYWQKLKNKSVSDALAQLTYLQNQIQLDEIPYLNYIFNMVVMCANFDAFKVVFAPQKTVIVEGETFNSEIFITPYLTYSNNSWNDMTLITNNHEIPVINGIAHFEQLQTTIGKKSVKANVNIKNSLTGQSWTTIGEFEYEVLPKCRRDCK